VIHHVFVDDHRYTVPDDQQLDSVQASILLAARDGGDFVDLRDATGGTTVVLITPSTPVRIEVQGMTNAAEADAVGERDAQYPDYFDADWPTSTL
jgi:hypothetical protein